MNCFYKILRSKAIVTNGTGVVLITPDEALAPSNKERVAILISAITDITATFPVQIVLNGVNCPVTDKFGNIVYGNQLKKGLILRGYYGINGYGATATHYQLVSNI